MINRIKCFFLGHRLKIDIVTGAYFGMYWHCERCGVDDRGFYEKVKK